MDIGLGEMDGCEATRRIKADPETSVIPIIALTASAFESDREKALRAGCCDFDTKPVDLARLLGQDGQLAARCLIALPSPKASLPLHRAPFPVRSLKSQGSPGRVVLPMELTYAGCGLATRPSWHEEWHGFLPGLAHGALLLKGREGQEGHGLGSPPAMDTAVHDRHRPPALPNAGDHPVP